MCNLYAGVLSFYALGRPSHIPSVPPAGLQQALGATSRSALATYEEGIRVLLREPRCFSGVSGGRAVIAAQLAELAVVRGSSRRRGGGPGELGPVSALLTSPDQGDSSFLLQRIAEECQ